MKGPRKLVEGDGSASALARELLREGRVEAMPASVKAALWKSIAAQVPGALVAPSAAAAAAKGATGLVALKATLAVVALGGSIWGGHHLLTADDRRAHVSSRPTPSPSSTTSRARTAEPAKPTETAKPTEPTRPAEAGRASPNQPSAAVPEPAAPASVPREAIEAPPPASAPRAPRTFLREPAGRPRPPRAALERDQPGASASPTPAESRLGEESQLVLDAREGLRAGHPSLVLRQLEEARSRFPDGTLTQEREALTIEALWRSGQTAAARHRAETFARTYPGSPHAARVQQLTSR